MNTEPLGDLDYQQLLAFRVGLRQFLRWSGEQAAAVGLTPTQHQLLLAIRGHNDSRGPNVGELADYLCTRHHSAVQLIDRTVQLGLIQRTGDEHDRRIVRLTLTKAGDNKLAELSATHLEEMHRLTCLLEQLADLSANPART